MNILLVEDDAESAQYVAKGFREAGHQVEVVADGREGLFHATEQRFDLLIIDRMLPNIDGLSLVKAARSAGVETPVLFLTALGSVSDRVEGLDIGADDYLVKPFSFAELFARANALARRPPIRSESPILVVGDLELDRSRRIVKRGGDVIDLQPREYQILEVLAANAGRVVTRTMLLEAIWGFNFDPTTNIVDSHVSRIRSKIDRGGDPPMIHTIRGAGYMLRAG